MRATTGPIFPCDASSACCPSTPCATAPRTGYIGSEVFVSLVDEQRAPWQENLRYISAEVLCQP